MAKYYLGIDIGGSVTKLVVLRGLEKQAVSISKFPTPKNPWTLETQLIRGIEEIIIKRHMTLSGIGIGIAGILDYKRGRVSRAHNLSQYDKWEVIRFFRWFRLPTAIDNDSRCFLRAEAAWGAGRNKKNVVGLAIGTGIGGGMMFDGAIYRGTDGSAGEVGHMVIDAPHRRTLEDLGALRAYKKFGDTTEAISIGVANLINILNPDIVILGGGAISSQYFSLNKIRLAAREFIMSPLARHTPIVKSQLGDAAQAIGAALLFAG